MVSIENSSGEGSMAKLHERNDKSKWISILIIFSLIQSLFVLSSPAKAIQSDGEEVKIMAVMHWYPVGTDYDGSTLQKNRNFPWESTDLSCWGRVDYPMTKTLKGPHTNPIFYTIVYVNVTAEGADSEVKEMVCIVLDDSGSIWLDPDGKFHNPHYDPVKDPANPLFLSGNCLQANQIEGRIRFSVDPFPGNNTQGPYSLQALLSGETIVFQYKGRRFLLGLLDREDYIEYTTVGFKDWDHELPLIPFLDNENHAVV